MTALERQRCFNHGDREAAVRCPLCGRYFCRECVTEHEERLVCAQCLHASAVEGGRRKGVPIVFVVSLALWLGGVMLTWFFFYSLGCLLCALPSSFHEATMR